jgi:hypothetical protein
VPASGNAYLQTCSINTFQDILQRIGSDFCFEMYDILFIASTIALISAAWVPEIWYIQTKVDTTWKHKVYTLRRQAIPYYLCSKDVLVEYKLIAQIWQFRCRHIHISNNPHLLVADRERHKGMVGRELSEARIALVEADMIDIGYRQDRLIDHLTSMAQDLYGITIADLKRRSHNLDEASASSLGIRCKVIPWLFLPILPVPFVPHPYCLKFI